jgi:hypothetical protein
MQQSLGDGSEDKEVDFCVPLLLFFSILLSLFLRGKPCSDSKHVVYIQDPF